jgi:hypothetical protein
MSLTPVAELSQYLEAMQNGKDSDPITTPMIPDPKPAVGRWPDEPGPGLTLPRCDWMDGTRHIHKLMGRIGTRIDGLQQRLIEIVVNDEQRCVGFMIEDGLIVTRASTLPDEFKLFWRSGVVKEIKGEVLAISKLLDLALIRTEPSGLANYGPAVDSSPIVGTLVFVPQMQSSSVMLGGAGLFGVLLAKPIPNHAAAEAPLAAPVLDLANKGSRTLAADRFRVGSCERRCESHAQRPSSGDAPVHVARAGSR